MDELTAAQARLAQAMNLARVGEDPLTRHRVRETGELFVRLFNGMLRMTRVHDLDNAAFDQPAHDLSEHIAELLNLLGVVHIVAVEDLVYVNEIRVRSDQRSESGRGLDTELRRHNVGGLTLSAVPSPDQIRALVACFAAKPDPHTPRTALENALAAQGITGVQLAGIYRFRISGELHQTEGRDLGEISSRAAGTVAEFWDALGTGRMQNALPARRIVTELLASGSAHDSEGLHEDPVGSSPHAAHAVRVSRVALLLGTALGLSEGALQDLGMTALFHDVGYAAREGALPARGEQPAQAGFAPPFERHPAAGARLLLRQRGFSEAKVRRLLAVLEHHRDDSPDDDDRPWLFSRILRIAEDYDSLIRVGRPAGATRPGLSPAEAIGCMAAARGRYDPVLLQLLINTLGRFPPGTLLLLADGRVVQVMSLVRSPKTFDRPLTRLVRTPEGPAPDPPTMVDLSLEGRVARVLRS